MVVSLSVLGRLPQSRYDTSAAVDAQSGVCVGQGCFKIRDCRVR